LRIGCTTEARPGIDVDPECKAAVAAAAALLESLGHDVVPVTLPVDWDAFHPAFGTITSAHIGAAIRARAAEVGREPEAADLEAVTRATIARAAGLSAFDYVDAVQTIHRSGRALGAFFTTVDMVLTPTLGALPPPLGVMFANADDNVTAIAEWGARAGRIAAFLGIMNATGQPAMSVPLHWSTEGLPVGVQFMGRFGDEATLLALARQLEEAAPWWHRRPVVTPGG
jgi:amidase